MGGGEVVGVHVELRERRPRGGELAAGRVALEQRHRSLGRLSRFGRSPRAPHHLRERDERHRFAALVTELSMTRERALERLDRTGRVVDEVALVRAPLQQLGS